MTQVLTIEGKKYFLLDEPTYSRLRRRTAEKLPELPAKDETGGIPAVGHIRALMARRIIQARARRGWSQAELARRAKIRVETLNRIEKCRHSADPKTAERIDKALRS